jgi:hypothetical protein
MTTVSKVVSLLAISVALTLSGSPVFAKSGGGPSQVKTSGTSATPSGGQTKPKPTHSCSKNPQPGCSNYVPGHTQPPCRGGHMGPNGVMIQCQ